MTVIKSEIDTYANLVVHRTENDLGRCGPMSNVYNSTVVAVCNRVIDPFVGFLILFFQINIHYGCIFYDFLEWILDWCCLVCFNILTNNYYLRKIVNAVSKIGSISRTIG